MKPRNKSVRWFLSFCDCKQKLQFLYKVTNTVVSFLLGLPGLEGATVVRIERGNQRLLFIVEGEIKARINDVDFDIEGWHRHCFVCSETGGEANLLFQVILMR